MKITLKPSLMILCGFVLAYISFLVPGTKVQYQVNGMSQSTYQSLVSAFGDKYGRDALPCSFARFENVPSAQAVRFLWVWQGIGRVLTLTPIFIGTSYAVRHKISHLRFFIFAVIFMGLIPVSIGLIFFNVPEPMCNQDDRYRILSFSPYVPFLLVTIVANLLGYVGTHADKNLSESELAAQV